MIADRSILKKASLPAVLLAGSFIACTAFAQATPGTEQSGAAPAPGSSADRSAANDPQTPAQIRQNNEMLGRLDATLTSCASADAKNAKAYEQYRVHLMREAVTIEASRTPEYREAYQSMIAEFGKRPKEELLKECAGMFGALPK